MSDVFGYDNNIKASGQVASADYALISIGAQKNSLVQSVDAQYAQRIEEVTQVGDVQIYWLPGRPQGRISIQQLVGASGFFKGWKRECGKLEVASIGVKEGQCDFEGKGSLDFDGAVIESLSIRLAVGAQTIAEGANIRVASMTSGQ